MGEDIHTDLINRVCTFEDATRWLVSKHCKKRKDKEDQSKDNIAHDTQKEEEQQKQHNQGLKTNLKPTKANLSVPKRDEKIERFLLNLKWNCLNKHLTKLKPKVATTSSTKSRACNKN